MNETRVEQTPTAAFVACRSRILPVNVAIATLALAPVIFALASFRTHFEYTALRHFSLPILVAEGIVVIAAMRSGFSICESLARLSRTEKVGLLIWLATVALVDTKAPFDPSAARALGLTWLLHVIMLLALRDLLSGVWAPFRMRLIWSIAWGLLAYSVAAVGLAGTVWGDRTFDWPAFGAGVTNVRHVGFYGIILTGIALGLLASMPVKQNKCAAILLVGGFFLCGWSGGRAVLISNFLTILAVTFASERSGRTTLVAISSAAFLMATVLSTALAPHELFGSGNQLLRLLEFTPAAGSLDAYSSSRLAIWRETLAHLGDHPLIGHGDGQFRHIVAAGGGLYNHPHNLVLQALFSWGIVGSAAAITFLLSMARSVPGAIRTEPAIGLPALGILVGLLAEAMLDGALYYPYGVVMALIALALSWSCRD